MKKIGNVKVMGPAFLAPWACPQGPLGGREPSGRPGNAVLGGSQSGPREAASRYWGTSEPVREAGSAVWRPQSRPPRPAAGIGVPASRPGGRQCRLGAASRPREAAAGIGVPASRPGGRWSLWWGQFAHSPPHQPGGGAPKSPAGGTGGHVGANLTPAEEIPWLAIAAGMTILLGR